MPGVDADKLGAGAEIYLDQLPAVGKLALGVFRLRQPDARARRIESGHGAWIGAVHRHGLTRGEHDIGEEALVALDQRCRDERGGGPHVSHLVKSDGSNKACNHDSAQPLAVAHFASGSGRSWKCTAIGFMPLPPSISHGARSPLEVHKPRPFQPAFGSSMRPSSPLM